MNLAKGIGLCSWLLVGLFGKAFGAGFGLGQLGTSAGRGLPDSSWKGWKQRVFGVLLRMEKTHCTGTSPNGSSPPSNLGSGWHGPCKDHVALQTSTFSTSRGSGLLSAGLQRQSFVHRRDPSGTAMSDCRSGLVPGGSMDRQSDARQSQMAVVSGHRKPPQNRHIHHIASSPSSVLGGPCATSRVKTTPRASTGATGGAERTNAGPNSGTATVDCRFSGRKSVESP